MRKLWFVHFLFYVLFIFTIISCEKDDSGSFISPGPISSWQTAPPETQSLNGTYFVSMINHVNSGEFGNIKSILIARNNYLVFEKYFNGAERDQLHILYSVTKSVTSVATGIAITKENNFTVDDKISNYFPGYSSYFDSLKSQITIKNVLTMSAGFQWNELSIPYSDPNNDFNKMFASSDEIGYVLQKNVVNTPGTKFTYNTGLPLLQSVILASSTGMSVDEYTNQNLFDKLGISNWSWNSFPDEVTNTGSGLSLRPIDLALIGQLLLNNGIWNSEQVVKQEWIDESTQNSINVNPYYNYGYYWWRFSDSNPVISKLPVNNLFFGWGYSDQFLFVVPVYNMLIVITADNNENDFPVFDILKDYIFQAVKD